MTMGIGFSQQSDPAPRPAPGSNIISQAAPSQPASRNNAASRLGRNAGGVASGGHFPILLLTAVSGHGYGHRVGVGAAFLVGDRQLEVDPIAVVECAAVRHVAPARRREARLRLAGIIKEASQPRQLAVRRIGVRHW